MTRRERLERKIEKRAEWAEKADARSASRFAAVDSIARHIPLGQPILVGHHSEKHARRDVARIHNGMAKGFEEQKLAEHHRQKADGLEIQLDRSVFSDDEDSIERLEARIAEREAKAEHHAAVNKAWRKGGIDAVRGLISEALAKTLAETMALCPWLKSPLDTTGIRASIRRDRVRIEQIKAAQERQSKAEASGVLIEGNEWVRVTFPEKPAREVLDALRGAGFRWGQGSWIGERAKLPKEVLGGLR